MVRVGWEVVGQGRQGRLWEVDGDDEGREIVQQA